MHSDFESSLSVIASKMGFRMSGPGNGTPMVSALRPWKRGLVLVCQECDGAATAKPSEVLHAAKRVARSEGRKQIRVTGSGCLDVCPSRATALAVSVDGTSTSCVVVESLDAVRSLNEMFS
jgi:hypothetical protein